MVDDFIIWGVELLTKSYPKPCVVVEKEIEEILSSWDPEVPSSTGDFSARLECLFKKCNEGTAFWEVTPWNDAAKVLKSSLRCCAFSSEDKAPCDPTSPNKWCLGEDKFIISFQDHILARIESHAKLVGSVLLGSATEIRTQLENKMTEIWRLIRNQNDNDPQFARLMFDVLISHGCIDLSSQMDPKQEAAIVVSRGDLGDFWMGRLYNGEKTAINTLGQYSHYYMEVQISIAHEWYVSLKLKHQNIHRLHGVIMFRDQYLGMVSEWTENGNLHEYLRKYPGIDRYQLCVQVASGLNYMHSSGYVHGNLKATNVLVSSDGVAKLSGYFYFSGVTSGLVLSESSNLRSGPLRWMVCDMIQ
ncbi:unnamed protein product [Rhizoctonia solani]|nr:unnamed protein product [Rhizoctonia solani]